MASINSNLFKAWVSKNIQSGLITGLNGLPVVQPAKDVYSEFNKNAPAKVRSNVVAAFCKVADIIAHGKSGGLGIVIAKDNSDVIYGIELNAGTETQCAVIKSGKVYACKKVGNSFESYIFKDGHDNGVLLLAAVIYYELVNDNDDEFTRVFKAGYGLFSKGIDENNIDDFAGEMAVLSENLYRRLCATPSKIEVAPLNEGGNVIKLTQPTINRLEFAKDTPKYGKFEALATAEAALEEFVVNSEKLEREWTEEEKRLIPNLPEWYVMPKEVPEICSLIQKSTGSYKPKRNFMFRGPSSTGKTSMARAVAASLGMPYVYITCSADTESADFLGEPMYDKEGHVRFIESNFIKAIKNGWVIEVQEPYVIAKQGVLTALNGLLDDGAGITLATGEYVQRHPDCVVIFTTNVSYVGCKKPNQSVLRRMNNVYDIELPSNEEIMKRVETNTGFKDRKILKKMISCMKSINDYLTSEMIDDGVCGVSEIIDWVSTLQITGDIVEAARSTVVSKATDSPEEQSQVAAKIETYFSDVDYSNETI